MYVCDCCCVILRFENFSLRTYIQSHGGRAPPVEAVRARREPLVTEEGDQTTAPKVCLHGGVISYVRPCGAEVAMPLPPAGFLLHYIQQ